MRLGAVVVAAIAVNLALCAPIFPYIGVLPSRLRADQVHFQVQGVVGVRMTLPLA